ncbi:MAG: UDP-glucose--hexose-1-phosphate uridylyltransferase [Anaerolineales bacterium]|nr:UDP-glucose--hexose-1-phosphate uridylyltransferase [Anaerolineales bacterium]
MNYDLPHRRFNPLTGEWVLVSPHRAKRPWLGQVEKTASDDTPPYDPTCYLCPGNTRVGGSIVNPAYSGTYVFDNDFPALLTPEAMAQAEGHATAAVGSAELFQSEPVSGTSRVVCFSPRHDLSLPQLSGPEVEAVLRTWGEQTRELGALPDVRYVQVFENKGASMGASNPHPHSQLWATSNVPHTVAIERDNQRQYLAGHERPLLIDYVEQERRLQERLVCTNDHFTILVPFWAVWPFEMMVIAHRPVSYLFDLTAAEFTALADVMRRALSKYDNLFEIPFPYSFGWHQAPFDDAAHPEWVLHGHWYPPLLRSATVRKFLVGYEMLAQPQRDLTAETAAARLRDLPDVHFSQRG